MPVWHKALKAARKEGDLVMLGVIQEQHAERCRLFAQWKQFDWPIIQDPVNQLALNGVPIVVDIDENGVTTSINPKVNDVLSSLAEPKPAGEPNLASTVRPNIRELETVAERDNSYSAWRELGDALVLWSDANDAMTDAITAYQHAARLEPSSAEVHFRLGVAHRKRYDGPQRTLTHTNVQLNPIAAGFESATIDNGKDTAKVNDFAAAVSHWGKALELNPNQYIYRRRIQQYGPRLTKPYPFYDWVEKARVDILARGETPIKLRVEPSGAELASPSKGFTGVTESGQSPDPEGRINRDTRNLVSADAVVVPHRVKPGQTVRVHVNFKPRGHVHWNNENSPLVFWLEVPDGWQAQRQLFESPLPKQAESSETRTFEFELKPTKAEAVTTTLKGYGLYYVCEETRGACLYLRQDVPIPVSVVAESDIQ